MRSLMLRVLAGTGVVGIAVLAPRMTRLLRELDRPAKSRDALYRRLRQAARRLEAAGFARVSGERGGYHIELTEKGEALAESLEFEDMRIAEPAFWDGKWRIVMFDVSEKRRATRVRLRHMLENAGFVRLQDSVWVYPYPCDEFVGLVRAYLKSGVGEMRSLVAEAIESDRPLRQHFRL